MSSMAPASLYPRHKTAWPKQHKGHAADAVRGHHKPKSTGGGRAWSEEEVSMGGVFILLSITDVGAGDVSNRQPLPEGAL